MADKDPAASSPLLPPLSAPPSPTPTPQHLPFPRLPTSLLLPHDDPIHRHFSLLAPARFPEEKPDDMSSPTKPKRSNSFARRTAAMANPDFSSSASSNTVYQSVNENEEADESTPLDTEGSRRGSVPSPLPSPALDVPPMSPPAALDSRRGSATPMDDSRRGSWGFGGHQPSQSFGGGAGLYGTGDSPLGSPGLGGLTPGLRSSTYSALPLMDQDNMTSGRNTPGLLGPEFSSADSYRAFNLRHGARTNSFASSNMLGRDYDSIAGLNSVAMDKYEGGSWDRSETPVQGKREKEHPREKFLSKYGVAKGAPRRKKCLILTIVAIIVVLLVVAVAVALGVVLGGKSSSGSSGSANEEEGTNGKELLVTGGNGTTIQLANGTSFTYINTHGGTWNSGLLNDTAQAQSYTKPLNQEWDYANDRIFGVNLGGWLVTEPFIAPYLYQPYQNASTVAVDEYTLSEIYIAEGGQSNLEAKMRAHYDTFITEQDFAEIAGAGLNWVRLPFPFWAIETVDGEPFLANVAWEYVIKAIAWARKYGIRINLDLHTVPGGQNTYNHSGRLGYMSWLNGVMGLVNAQRTLNIIRSVTEFISQPEIRNVVPVFSVLNEPNLPFGIGQDQLKAFYGETYNMMRNITGTGKGNGPMIAFHDGFSGLSIFENFLTNSDRVAYDTHPYICFTPPFTDSFDSAVANVCNTFTSTTDSALANHGAYFAGEWSLALNDCGLFLNNVNQGTRYEATYPGSTTRYGSCEGWDDWVNYNTSRKENLMRFALAEMSSLRNWFFWTWTIGDSILTNQTVNPAWNYKLGLQQGWMPTNINDVVASACATEATRVTSAGTTINTATATSWNGQLSAWQTGDASSYPVTIAASNAWPPATLQSTTQQTMTIPASSLPSMTPTGTIYTVPSATFSVSVKGEATPTVGAWFNAADTTPYYAWPAGCPAMPSPYYNGSLPDGFPCS